MSKKVQQPVINLADTFSEFKDIKNVDRLTMMRVLEDVFSGMIRKKYGDADNFDVIVNTEHGELEIHRNRLVVEDDEVELDHKQISLTDALKIDEDLEVNDEATDLVNMAEFGRRSILSARQTLYTQILELEKEEVYKMYKDKEGEIAVGEVYQIWKKELMVIDNDGTELILPKDEMIPSDFYRKGDSLRAVVKEVEMKNGSPRIVLSRTSPMFLERLFELEVPEILDGVIIIKDIVREPGERAKVAVESYDERIDPVGACVGMKGSRIHGIVRELRNESIDVINHTTNLPLYIQRSLNPANISAIKIEEDTKIARVTLVPDQISLAIGKGGHNIRLAGKLVGYTIEVYREEVEGDMADVELTEFLDEIEPWIIDELKAVGCDTASNVLAISTEDLVSRTDLEEETIVEIKRILQAELDK